MKNVLGIVVQQLEKEYGDLQSYLSWDCETTGLVADEDLIYELGHCIVENGTGQFYQSDLLNWYQHTDVDAAWLTWKIGSQHVKMAELKKPCHISRSRILQGEAPEKVLKKYVDLFEQAARDRTPLLVFNGLRFDCPRFEFAVKEWLGIPFSFDKNLLIDVGAVIKASVLGIVPDVDEPISRFSSRVLKAFAGGAKWGLSTYCVDHFKLVELYGLDLAQAHSAGWDAMATALVFEEIRQTAKV